MDRASSSPDGQSQHSALLQQIIEMRGDLERVTTQLQQTVDQNKTLTSNYEIVKEELLDTRRKYNESRENYLTCFAEKAEMERQNETFFEKLKIQLTEKTQEFESLRDKLAPQDLDSVRVKVQEELEIPHKQRLQAMELEVQKHKDAFYTMKRELESTKAEYETYSQNQQREVTAIRDEHDGVTAVLRDTIARLQEKDHIMEKDDIIRTKNMKIHELTIGLENAMRDLRQMQKERDDALHSVENFRIQHQENLESLKNRVTIAEAAKMGMDERISRLTSELEKKESAIRIAKTASEDAEASSENARRALQNSESMLATLRLDHTKEIEDHTVAYASERSGLIESFENVNEKLREKDDLVRKLMRDISEIQLRSESNESDMRRSHMSNLGDLKKRIATLELENLDFKSKFRSMESSKNSQEEQSKAEMGVVKGDVQRIKREKDTLHDKLREAEHATELEKRKNAGLRRDLAAKKETMEIELGEEKDRAKELEPLKMHCVELDARNKMLEQQNSEYLSANTALQSDASEKLKTMADSYKNRVQEMKQKMQGELTKEKKRADAYKSKAIEAHNKIKGLS